jgi:ubiquinone/menaquinone biosynthesis C-methylase UbiE
MAHVEYHCWLELISSIIKRYCSTDTPRMLELGGGTGVLACRLCKKGLTYFGSDYSYAMCLQARKKGLPFVCADARRLPFQASFDFAIFLYDGINYLLELSDYDRLFCEVHGSLADKGLLLFDITTETNSLKHFCNFLDFEDYDEYSYVRHSYFEPKSKHQFNDFTIFSRHSHCNGTKLFEKHCERHVQRVLSVDEIKECIPQNLFDVIGIWDGFTFKRYSSRSERVHFLLRKRDSR